MDVTATYRERLHDALSDDPERFTTLLRRRWQGKDGPALDQDRSWSSRLFYAYRETPGELRPRWALAVCEVLDDFVPARLLGQLSLAERLELLGALELAQGIYWPSRERERLDAFLTGALRHTCASEDLPPRDLWREDGFLGQPEADVVTALLRLAVRRLVWESVAEQHWRRALDGASELGQAVVAWRLWEIARWAIAASKIRWIAVRIDTLDERLGAADYEPGNLTRLFFLTEMEHGPARVKELILAAFRSVDPETLGERQDLAEKLDYFGKSQREIRDETGSVELF